MEKIILGLVILSAFNCFANSNNTIIEYSLPKTTNFKCSAVEKSAKHSLTNLRLILAQDMGCTEITLIHQIEEKKFLGFTSEKGFKIVGTATCDGELRVTGTHGDPSGCNGIDREIIVNVSENGKLLDRFSR